MSEKGKSYAELLKDPRWQKVRLQVLERDGWKCQICGDQKSTLHVHHMRYFYGMPPWDYPLSLLATLCKGCHDEETESKSSLLSDIQTTLANRGAHSLALQELFHFLNEIPENECLCEVFRALRFAFSQPDFCKCLLNRFDLNDDPVVNAQPERTV